MDGATSVTPPPDGMTDADIARRPTEVLLEVLRHEGFAEPNPRPIFPNSPGLLRVEPYSEGLRDRIWALARMPPQVARPSSACH
jgi:hypothetical protein